MTIKEDLTAAYRHCLLAEAPVASLKEGAKDREKTADWITGKDLDRFSRALQRAGMRIVRREAAK